MGGVQLSATATGRHLELTLHVGLERADILGYHVWRIDGSRRSRVNACLLPVLGVDGASLVLNDTLPGLASLRGGSALRYEVEVVGQDGRVLDRLGPFEVVAGTRRERDR